MKKPIVLLATAASAVALAAAAGVGIASADPSPTPTPSASATPQAGPSTPAKAKPSQDPAKKKHRDLAGRALHGEVTLGGKKHRVVDVQRGTVSAVSAGSVSVRSADGFDGTYVVGPKTKVRVAKKEAAIGDVAVGDHVRVVATRDGQTLTATRVVDRKG
ncbi:hypothetical protein GCM10022197_18580 [Microlunatus spumicola]|uniref:DUF5666 domain-containing protein n=1 Tax=Microlunatus spumicola TaxID=81499 RepID=A0ABP6X8S2_9ACTN